MILIARDCDTNTFEKNTFPKKLFNEIWLNLADTE